MNHETKGKEMARKNLLKSESAAAIAVVAVLLLGLAFTIISVVKLNYTPEWKIDAERDYSYDSWSNMEDVKTRVDMFTRFMGSDIDYPYGLSATVPFRMGGGEVPVFEPSKSNSKLAVNTEKCTMVITLDKHPDDPRTVDCGGVTYYSKNRQYPDQVFRYENGALILSQGENSQMKRNPSFNINKTVGNNYTVTINAVNLTGEPESISSSSPTALRLTGCSTNHILNSYDYLNESVDSFNLNISTHYTDAWVTYLNDTAKNAGLAYGTDYTIESIPYDYVCISFLSTGSNKLEDLYASESVIQAELGAGGCLDNGEVDYSESDEDEDESEKELTHGNRIILNKPEIGGFILSGTYIQFKNNGQWDYIEIDNKKKNLGKGQTVKLVINGNQTAGSADMNAGDISNFNFNVEVYIDGKSEGQGKVTGIWMDGYSDYKSNLTYKLPSYLSGIKFQVDDKILIDGWWPENASAVNLYNIGPSPTNNKFLRIDFTSGKTYFDCSADYEIINT